MLIRAGDPTADDIDRRQLQAGAVSLKLFSPRGACRKMHAESQHACSGEPTIQTGLGVMGSTVVIPARYVPQYRHPGLAIEVIVDGRQAHENKRSVRARRAIGPD